jgi:hypothetical protein
MHPEEQIFARKVAFSSVLLLLLLEDVVPRYV